MGENKFRSADLALWLVLINVRSGSLVGVEFSSYDSNVGLVLQHTSMVFLLDVEIEIGYYGNTSTPLKLFVAILQARIVTCFL
jgi:hypothetical protein